MIKAKLRLAVLWCLTVQVRQQMEEQVAQKSTEVEQYLQRVHEMEEMYRRLEDALEDERRARQDEETVRKLQARSVDGGRGGRASANSTRTHRRGTEGMYV